MSMTLAMSSAVSSVLEVNAMVPSSSVAMPALVSTMSSARRSIPAWMVVMDPKGASAVAL